MSSVTAQSLPKLRAEIDAIDREFLQLLARRMAIVTEISEYKRAHGLKIRDREREKELYRDRGQAGRRLGLPATEIESLFRVILRASREYQASLRTEVPKQMEPKTIAVIGGRGGFGRLLVNTFADLGHTVRVADDTSALTPREAVEDADVVIISVPISVTEQVIHELGPHVRPDALMMDVTSIKQGPMQAMLASTKASVVGTHPMFGPDVHALGGQRVVVCEGRGDAWLTWVKDALSAKGLVITETTPEEHDRAMAVVQVLTHFQTQVLGLTLSRLNIPLEKTLAFTSPAYLLELYVVARHFAQDPELYGPIEMLNPLVKETTQTFGQAVRDLTKLIGEDKDQSQFNQMFEDVRRFFGDFTEEALEQSSFLIDRLVERS